MDSALKQRLIGAAVLVALAVIFLPMLLKGTDPDQADAARIPLDAPAPPEAGFETRELPLLAPGEAPAGGVTGLGRGEPGPADPDGVVTVDQGGDVAPRVDALPVVGPDEAPPVAIDPATGEPVAIAPAREAAPPPEPEREPVPAPAPAPTPAEAAPLPVATAGGRYTVNVGAFTNLDNARALADRLRGDGLPLTSESIDVGGRPAMRLRVGPYAERAAAEQARLRVQRLSGSTATVVALDAAVAPATPATPAPAPAPAPATAEVGFAVQLGAFSREADATALRERARAAGFVAFQQRVNTDRGPVWRVRIGPEADRAAAERRRGEVVARLGGEAIVVSHP